MRGLRWLVFVIAGSALAVTFGSGREVMRLPAELEEVSGMVASRTNRDVLWVHNDSGDQPRVYAVSTGGRLLGTYTLEGAMAVDWEDMSIGPAPGGGSYLYMADIGDNNARRASVRIYRVAEPRVDADQARVTATLTGVTTFEFVYEGGARDAESFFVDPLTGDFYVVSKREASSRLYRGAAPKAGERNTFVPLVTFSFTQATGASMSADGLQVLVRGYSLEPRNAERAGHYWRRADGTRSVADMMALPDQAVALTLEVQGEAIAFAPDGGGFYTTSERATLGPAPATFYPAVP